MFLTHGMLNVKGFAANQNAGRLVRRIASNVGYRNQRTETTFVALKMATGYSFGVRLIQVTGVRLTMTKMRYKRPYPKKQRKTRQLDAI